MSPFPANRAKFLPIAAFAFGGLLWFLGCFYFLGDLGRYSDDWSISMSDPLTGSPHWGVWPFERAYFWRPVLQLFLHYAFLLLWDHMWIFHLMNVAAHGAAAWLLYRLLRTLLLVPHAAFAGAALFLLFPFNYEVIFWSTAMTTGVPAGLAILLALLAAGYARDTRGLPRLWFIFGLAFIIPCWYEQPGAIIVAFPLLYFTVRPAAERLGQSLARIAALMIACGVPLMIYIALLIGTAPKAARGGVGSFISAAEAPARLHEMLRALKWFYTSRLAHCFMGGLQSGWSALSTPTGIAAAGAVAVVGGVFLCAWCLGPVAARSAVIDERRDRSARWVCSLGFGIVVFIASWLPVYPIRGQIIEARMNYFSCVGLAVVLACVIDVLLRTTRRSRGWPLIHVASGFAVTLAAWAGAVSQLGFQSMMQLRTRADLSQVAELKRLVPNPPSGAVFFALEDNFAPTHTGYYFFDRALLSWISAPWSSNAMLRHEYRRTDFHANARNIWVPLEIADMTADSFRATHTNLEAGTPDPKGGTRIAWANTIPFIVNADGSIRLVSSMTVPGPGGTPLAVALPLVPRDSPQAVSNYVVPSGH